MPSKNIEKIIEEFEKKFAGLACALNDWAGLNYKNPIGAIPLEHIKDFIKEYFYQLQTETEKRVRKETIEEVIRMLPYEIKSRLTNLLNEKE